MSFSATVVDLEALELLEQGLEQGQIDLALFELVTAALLADVLDDCDEALMASAVVIFDVVRGQVDEALEGRMACFPEAVILPSQGFELDRALIEGHGRSDTVEELVLARRFGDADHPAQGEQTSGDGERILVESLQQGIKHVELHGHTVVSRLDAERIRRA
jgi:hypothetical protein